MKIFLFALNRAVDLFHVSTHAHLRVMERDAIRSAHTELSRIYLRGCWSVGGKLNFAVIVPHIQAELWERETCRCISNKLDRSANRNIASWKFSAFNRRNPSSRVCAPNVNIYIELSRWQYFWGFELFPSNATNTPTKQMQKVKRGEEFKLWILIKRKVDETEKMAPIPRKIVLAAFLCTQKLNSKVS